MANDLKFNQLVPVINEIVAQATGVAPPKLVTTADFVAVGQLALKVGYDPLITAISQVLSRTVFSRRPYSAKFYLLNVSNETYGNHVRKIQPVDKDFEEDDRFSLVDGQSIDHYRVNKPKVVQTNFYGAEQFQKSLTIYKDQLDCAFNSADEFQQFITMILGNAMDQIEQAKENTSRMTLNNMIAAIYLRGNAVQRHNVLEMYNQFAGTALTMANIFTPENYPNFARWLYGHIQSVSDFLTERSATYHMPIGSDIIMRHTPKQDQRLYIQSSFAREMESVVTSTTYHDSYTVFPPNEKVNFWQSIQNPSLLNIEPALLGADRNYEKGEEVEIEKVVGVLFDREAAGVTTVNEWSQNTPFNARGGYYNQFWHFTNRYWNDFSENAVIFFMEDTK